MPLPVSRLQAWNVAATDNKNRNGENMKEKFEVRIAFRYKGFGWTPKTRHEIVINTKKGENIFDTVSTMADKEKEVTAISLDARKMV